MHKCIFFPAKIRIIRDMQYFPDFVFSDVEQNVKPNMNNRIILAALLLVLHLFRRLGFPFLTWPWNRTICPARSCDFLQDKFVMK